MKENGQPTAEEKGKGKMIGHAATNGEKEGEDGNISKSTKDAIKPEENKDGMLETPLSEDACLPSLLLTQMSPQRS